ncbi:MAG: TonB family protein [Archangiaceae bacterium]|nr:TonB family protein [Archangiaceae bacterium]
MLPVLRALTAASFACLLLGATAAFWFHARAEAASPGATATAPGDGGSSAAVVLPERRYLPASKSFGGAGLDPNGGLGGLGSRGSPSDGGGAGEGIGGLGRPARTDAAVALAEPVVMGSLDQGLVRTVIHRNRNPVRYCYEQELAQAPELEGKVVVKFVITREGTVDSPKVTESTVGRSALEDCIVSRVKGWRFPKPAGGGVVVVTYPFVFRREEQ